MRWDLVASLGVVLHAMSAHAGPWDDCKSPNREWEIKCLITKAEKPVEVWPENNPTPLADARKIYLERLIALGADLDTLWRDADSGKP